MKIQKQLLIYIISIMAVGCNEGQSKSADKEDLYKKINNKYQFKVRGCGIIYNGTDLYMSSDVEPWIKALGKNYRAVDSVDGINRIKIYIYDDIGVRLVERQSDKKIDNFRFRLEKSPHDIRIETDAEIEAELKKPNTEQARTIFKDAIDIEEGLAGTYLMHGEKRTQFESDTSISYRYASDCTTEQKSKGAENFAIELSTSFENPEIIDFMYFNSAHDKKSNS